MSFYNFKQEDFVPPICLKCGRLSSTYFQHIESEWSFYFILIILFWWFWASGYKITKKSVNVPVCAECEREFKNWTKKHSTLTFSDGSIVFNVICGLVLGIGALLITRYTESPIPIVIASIVFSVILIGIVTKIIKIVARENPNSPFKYIKFRGKQIYVRPGGQGNWINREDWFRGRGELDFVEM